MKRSKHRLKRRRVVALDPVAIGKRIRSLRVKRGYRLADLAQVVGANVQRVWRWERGYYVPPIREGLAMCLIFARSLEFLYLGSPRRGKFWEHLHKESESFQGLLGSGGQPGLRFSGPAAPPAQRPSEKA